MTVFNEDGALVVCSYLMNHYHKTMPVRIVVMFTKESCGLISLIPCEIIREITDLMNL